VITQRDSYTFEALCATISVIDKAQKKEETERKGITKNMDVWSICEAALTNFGDR
jgi:hypothetical protein